MIRFTTLLFFFLFPFFSNSQNWSKTAKSGNAGLTDIIFISKSKGFALSNGKVLKTQDTGKSWSQILSSYNGFSRIAFPDSKNGYIIGANDLVLKTTDEGDTWNTKQTGNSDDDFISIFAKNKDSVFVIGYDNLDNGDSANFLNYSYNGGNSWSRINLNSKKYLPALHLKTKNQGYLINFSGSFIESINGFSTYNSKTLSSFQPLDFKIVKDSIVVIVGLDGKIMRSTNFGKSFSSVSSPVGENLKSLHFANDTFGMACGNKGSIIYTSNSGASWTKMSSGTQLDLNRIYVINPFLAWAVGFSTSGDSLDILKFEDKSCISRFVRLPRDTVICDKYDYETPFMTKGKNKPKWEVNDALTNLYQKNDSVGYIDGNHEGKFIISYELQSCEEIIRDTTTLYIWRNPSISVHDSTYCGQVSDNISFSCFACSFLWSNNSNAYNFEPTKPGKYWVRVTNHCKTLSDTFTLNLLPIVKLNLGGDTILCNQSAYTLNTGLALGKHQWHDGDTNAYKMVKTAGTFSVNFKNKCNNISDTIAVAYKKTPSLSLGKDSVYCEKLLHAINLDTVVKNADILWNDGSQLSNRNLSDTGQYSVRLSNVCGTVYDTIYLGLLNTPLLKLGLDSTYCKDFVHKVNITKGKQDHLLWWDGKDSLTRQFEQTGQYHATLKNKCGLSRDTLVLKKLSIPVVNLGKDTIIGIPFSLVLDAKNEGCTYLWSTGSTQQTITVTERKKYWVRASNYCGSGTDTIELLRSSLIHNLTGIQRVVIFPNPLIGDELMVQADGEAISVSILDFIGKPILSAEMKEKELKIDLSKLSAGQYSVIVYFKDKGNVARRFIKN